MYMYMYMYIYIYIYIVGREINKTNNKHIEDAMRRDTAAPQFRGSALSWFVSASGAWRFRIGVPFVDFV